MTSLTHNPIVKLAGQLWLIVLLVVSTLAIMPAHSTENPPQQQEKDMLSDDLKTFLQGWGDAWSPKNNASEFTKHRFGPYYADGDRLLAFDNTEGDMPTVIRGGATHGDTWGPWVAKFSYWSFTPDLSSAKVFGSGDVRTVALFVDVLGKLPSGDTIEARQHVTVVIETTDKGLRIVHESIWGPVRDDT